MLIDISRPLFPGSPHWPGDRPTAFRLNARITDGASCNVGELSLSVHNGSHVDAPFHYDNHGATIDALDPELFVGPARVIDARGRTELTADLFSGLTDRELAASPRILFRTDAWGDPASFPTAWPLLEPSLPAWLAQRGVRLVGLDVPSVDELTCKEMTRHRLMLAAGLLILESLDLRGVEPGPYELIALPLRLLGADGSPVRAVLRPKGSGR
jgi:arylformamidase